MASPQRNGGPVNGRGGYHFSQMSRPMGAAMFSGGQGRNALVGKSVKVVRGPERCACLI